LNRLFDFDVGPFPAPGGPHTIRVSAPGAWSRLDSSSWKPPHTGGFGPSERFVATLDSAGPRGWFLLPTGEGGNPLGPWYRDMAKRWYGSGRLLPVPLDRAGVRAITVRRLRLVPSEEPGSEGATTTGGGAGDGHG
jgi:acyl-homoserine lactone acylase PvdQ